MSSIRHATIYERMPPVSKILLHILRVMNKYALILVLFFSSCTASVPSRLYLKPELYSCHLYLETQWNGLYPIETFSKDLHLDEVYTDYTSGIQYKLVRTSNDNVLQLQVLIQ